MTQRNLKDRELDEERRQISSQNQNFQSILGSSMGKRNIGMNQGSSSLGLGQMQNSAIQNSTQNVLAIHKEESNKSLGTVSSGYDGN